ncbi:MAG: SLC13/DASS family transporter [Anaerolineales bacterium]|nr:SLC13/DASS family transporter [Anaerolineales bacterium]
MIITFVILAVTILLFVINKLRPDVVAMLSLLALFLTGVLTAPQALAGFADSTVIMVAALFVVGEGLAQTGITAWMGQRLTGWAGSSETRLLIALMLGTALLSAFLSNTGTVAVLMPAVVAAVWRMRSLPSRFLMPLAFAASMGGLMTLIGTPPNIVISDTLTAAGLQPFSFFDFAKIGLPLLACAVVFMVLVGRRLLPVRESARPAANVEDWVNSVVESYGLESRLFRLRTPGIQSGWQDTGGSRAWCRVPSLCDRLESGARLTQAVSKQHRG